MLIVVGALIVSAGHRVMHFGVVLREERYLAEKFGQVYGDYRAGVRRYL